jgi:hypothetical protein
VKISGVVLAVIYLIITPAESSLLKVQNNVYQERNNLSLAPLGGRNPKVGANHKQREGKIESEANA